MKIKSLIVLAGFALMLMSVPGAQAQVNSNTASVNLNAVMAETISVSAAPGTVNFTPLSSNGVTNGDSSITVNTSWVLQPSRGTMNVYAYFVSAAAALTHSTDVTFVIPTSRVEGQINAGAFSAFTGNSPFGAGSSLTVASVAIVGNNKNSSRSDSLTLRIDTTGAALPAGTYTGTLLIQAQAI